MSHPITAEQKVKDMPESTKDIIMWLFKEGQAIDKIAKYVNETSNVVRVCIGKNMHPYNSFHGVEFETHRDYELNKAKIQQVFNKTPTVVNESGQMVKLIMSNF